MNVWRLRIGRAATCDLVLDDRHASQEHCDLYLDDIGRVVLQDLGSTNGTHVIRRGVLIPPSHVQALLLAELMVDKTTLKRGDTIIVGRTYLPIREGSVWPRPVRVEATIEVPRSHVGGRTPPERR